MSEWTNVGENLVRHVGGKIYLRAWVAGKSIRVSLKTTDLRIAKLKRDERLAAIRHAAAAGATTKVRSLGDAIDAIAARIANEPQLEERTSKYYVELIGALKKTLPLEMHASKWSRPDAEKWWKTYAKSCGAQRVNNGLMLVKRAMKLLIELGIRMDNPALSLKRMRIERPHLDIPSREMMDAVIESIREQKKAHSEEAANYVTFLAYAGCRSGQAKAFHWKHVEDDWLTFPSMATSQGVSKRIAGTKGADTRKLPINAPLRKLLDAMRPADPAEAIGPLFEMLPPREALTNACVRLGIEHLRIHDLRHFFCTEALKCGVTVPTVSRWLGHKDGGVLVLKTYGHLLDDHSLSEAGKM